jgi:hypothetical protein
VFTYVFWCKHLFLLNRRACSSLLRSENYPNFQKVTVSDHAVQLIHRCPNVSQWKWPPQIGCVCVNHLMYREVSYEAAKVQRDRHLVPKVTASTEEGWSDNVTQVCLSSSITLTVSHLVFVLENSYVHSELWALRIFCNLGSTMGNKLACQVKMHMQTSIWWTGKKNYPGHFGSSGCLAFEIQSN